MADSKDTKGQEEYQYSGEEFGITEDVGPQEFQGPPPASGTSLPGILGRKFVVPGLVVIITLILYLWMSLSTKQTEEPKDIGGAGAMKAKLSQSDSAPAATPAESIQQAKEVPKEPLKLEEPALADAAVTPSESPVESPKINELNTSINQLQTAVTDIGKDLVNMSAKLDEVEKLAQKAIEEKQVTKPVVSKVQRRPSNPKVLPMIYEVKAVVPGRAWIQSENGNLTTIELGETLVGYGKVESIDVVEGKVKLSSGAVIQYGLYDR